MEEDSVDYGFERISCFYEKINSIFQTIFNQRCTNTMVEFDLMVEGGEMVKKKGMGGRIRMFCGGGLECSVRED